MMRKFLFAILALALALCLLPAISQPAEAATEVSKGIDIITDGPSIGMAISDLTATALKARVESIKVYNAYTEEEITEGFFEKNVVYLIHYILQPYEGQKFAEKVGISLNGVSYRYQEAESETRAVYVQTFTSCTSLSTVELTVPVFQEGMRPEDITVSVPDDATYRVESFQIIDLQTGSNAESLHRDGEYRLSARILPGNGRILSNNFSAYCNDLEMSASRKNSGTYGICSIDFTFDVGEIPLSLWTPKLLKDGDNLYSSSVWLDNDRVTASRCWWTDDQKNTVTGNAEGGKDYFLTFIVTAIGPVGPWESPVVIAGDHEVITEVLDETRATVYIRFTAKHDAGTVEVFPQGIAQGNPITGVTAQVLGNVKMRSIIVKDENRNTVKTGVFESGHTYSISISMDLLEGYTVGSNTKVYVNGEEYSISESYNKDYITITIPLDTLNQINTAKVSLSGMGVGKSISKVKITPASGSKFDIYDHSWASTDTSSTKFKKGELYQICVTIEADTGYRFTEDTVFTIGGKDAFEITILNSGKKLKGTVQFSYRTEVTKVTLPAMPKTITPGTNLPTNFKVSSSAKYTLEPVWLSMNTMETVTMANKNGCYVLTYVVSAKDGCEFTEDTVFYVDGKKVKPVLLTAYYAQIMKPYNVGLTVVDRIELTLPEPEHGATPGEVTISADAPYAVSVVSWGVNNTGKLEDAGDTVTTFQNYKYHFLAVEMVAAPGYIFADKVTLYINGDKYTTLEDINLGISYSTVVGFGKLGEIAKLTAPELELDGFTLNWNGVPNADGYEIYRATSKSGTYTKVTTVTDTTWQDTPVQGKSYYYKVKAIFTPDTSKNSGYSNVVSIAYKLDAPTIAVENGDSGKPVISWEKMDGAKKYTVYRATSETGKYTKLGTTTKLTYTDSKAKAGTTYFYKVIANASSSTYNSGYSNVASCNVICGTPTVTVKIDTATGKPSLSWKKVDSAVGYRILRRLPGEEDFTPIATGTAVTFLDTTAPIDTKCVYMVQAMGKADDLDGKLSKEITATSGIAQPKLKTSIDASGKPEIFWQAVEGATVYEIYRSTKSSKGYTLLTTVEATGYTDTSVAAGKTYYYKVVAVGTVSKSAESAYIKASGKCATPKISVSINETSGKPEITWEKVTSAKKYTVYRATSETGKYTKLGTTTKLTYTDSKASVGTTYFYKIIANASSSSYNSGYSNLESCLTICAKPVVKVTTVAATGKPSLSWGKVTGAVEYQIFRLDNGTPVQLATTTKLTYVDETAVAGVEYTYQVCVIAKDPTCNSAAAATVTATCAQPKIKGKVGETGKPEITWETVEGATKYVVYRSTSKSKGYKAIDETTDLTYTDATAAKSKTYYYKVVAVCEDSESAQSAYVTVKSK